MKKRYTYEGGIWVFNTQVCKKWTAATWAVSQKQAKGNLLFRAKKAMGYSAQAKLSIDEKLILEQQA